MFWLVALLVYAFNIDNNLITDTESVMKQW